GLPVEQALGLLLLAEFDNAHLLTNRQRELRQEGVIAVIDAGRTNGLAMITHLRHVILFVGFEVLDLLEGFSERLLRLGERISSGGFLTRRLLQRWLHSLRTFHHLTSARFWHRRRLSHRWLGLHTRSLQVRWN